MLSSLRKTAKKAFVALAASAIVLTGFPLNALAVNAQSTLKVVKVVVGGTKTATDFPLFIQKQGPHPNPPTLVTTGVANPVDNGTYNVTETGDPNYAATYSSNCANGTIGVNSGNASAVTCTITNTYTGPALPTTGNVVVTKEVVGSDADPLSFPLFLNGESITSGATYERPAGVYTVTETNQANYVASFSGACNANGEVTVVVGLTANCTITNTYVVPPPTVGTVTVTKVVVNSGVSASTFPLFVGDESVDSGIAEEFAPGTYAVTETNQANFTASYSEACANGSITVEAGVEYSCVITNTYVAPEEPPTGCGDGPACTEGSSCIQDVCVEGCGQGPACGDGYMCSEEGACVEMTEEPTTGTVTVFKNVVGSDALSSSFTLAASGTNPSQSSFAGSSEGTVISFEAGAFSIEEPISLSNYVVTYEGCTGTIEAGDELTCTITNTYVPPVVEPDMGTLTVVKVVVGGPKDIEDFPLFIQKQGENPNPAVLVTSGVPNSVENGNYLVTETGDEDYEATFSENCDDGSISIANGESQNDKTCTITNTFIGEEEPTVGTVTVTKVVVNSDASASSFALFVGDEPVVTDVAEDFAPGAYVVSETAQANFTATFTGACDENGNITVVAGQEYSCVITNTYVAPEEEPTTGTVTVFKTVVNGSATSTDWTYHVGSSTATLGVALELAGGTYAVTETGVSGYNASYSGSCAGGSVTVVNGQNVNCTITNTFIVIVPPQCEGEQCEEPETPSGGGGGGSSIPTGYLTVITNVLNDNGGSLTPAHFLMSVVANPNSAFGGVAGSGLTMALMTGTFSVSGEDEAGYAKTLTGDCSGDLGLNESKTCTVTYEDLGPTVTPPTGGTPTDSGTTTPPTEEPPAEEPPTTGPPSSGPTPEVAGETDEPGTPPSNPPSNTPSNSGNSGTSGPAPEVLGDTDAEVELTVSATETEAAPTEEAPAETEGFQGKGCPWFWGWILCYWWILLLIAIAAILIYWSQKRKEVRKSEL